ncbi:DUF512 domain-containing protein [candidate division KSB1 bacterium]|nr:DUF512 domain-containing protein [candidate division KSB1 bacterium]
MKIIYIEPGSLAAHNDIREGDDLRKINRQPVRDIIDYQFLASDECIELELHRNGSRLCLSIEKAPDKTLGISLEQLRPRLCGNQCIFCFIDQNPPGLRKTLYVKDEDFRLSFLYGSYITLSHISQSDLRRIVEQRLSPLYISIHAADPRIRKMLLGLHKDDHLFEKLAYLAGHGIELHAQIVLCPGFNDGPVLDDTLTELEKFFPELATIAIVPVGLTKHRAHLPKLQPVSRALATNLVDWGKKHNAHYKKLWNRNWVFLADEIYLLAEFDVPDADYYEDFAQLENGVGMVRDFLDSFSELQRNFPRRLEQPRAITLVTGISAFPFMNDIIAARLNKIDNLRVTVQPVKNQFYGNLVTVSGLLAGEDIFDTLRNRTCGQVVFLPENCVNDDGLFLDDWTIEKMSNALERPVHLLGNDFSLLFEQL